MTTRPTAFLTALIVSIGATAFAHDQPALDDTAPRNLPQYAFKYEQGCHASQASRLKALPKEASDVERMQIEIIDSDVCPCMARKIIELKDQQLAERILAADSEVDRTFFEPAFQECSVAVMRKTILPSCLDEVPEGKLSPAAAQAACQCFSDEVGKLDDATVRDDAVTAYLNYQERAKDPGVKLYVGKLESLKAACFAKQTK